MLASALGRKKLNLVNMFLDDSNAKQIRSIPEGIWWSLITMTTVGYGDKIPVSFGGKIAGSCCAMMGILCMSFPVPGRFSISRCFFIAYILYLNIIGYKL